MINFQGVMSFMKHFKGVTSFLNDYKRVTSSTTNFKLVWRHLRSSSKMWRHLWTTTSVWRHLQTTIMVWRHLTTPKVWRHLRPTSNLRDVINLLESLVKQFELIAQILHLLGFTQITKADRVLRFPVNFFGKKNYFKSNFFQSIFVKNDFFEVSKYLHQIIGNFIRLVSIENFICCCYFIVANIPTMGTSKNKLGWYL